MKKIKELMHPYALPIFVLLFCVLLELTPQQSPPMPPTKDAVGFIFDPSGPPETIQHYTLHIGTESGNYTNTLNIGTNTFGIVTNLNIGTTYYLTVTATGVNEVRSDFSKEVSFVAGATEPVLQGVGVMKYSVLTISVEATDNVATNQWKELGSWQILLDTDYPAGNIRSRLDIETIETVEWK